MSFSFVSGHVCLHEWSQPLLVEHIVTLLVDLRDSRRNQSGRPILILVIGPSALVGHGAGDVFVTALPAILDGCRELVVVAEATDARSGTLRSVFAEPRASQNGRPTPRHFKSIDEALRHVESVAPHDILYPFGQPRPDAEYADGLQRLSDEQLSERRPAERDGGGSLRAAA